MFGFVTKKKYKEMENLYINVIEYHKEQKLLFGSKLDDVIKCLDRYKKMNPKGMIIVETTKGSVQLEIGDALIYEGQCGELVIDAE